MTRADRIIRTSFAIWTWAMILGLVALAVTS